jgi:hypothetical protein
VRSFRGCAMISPWSGFFLSRALSHRVKHGFERLSQSLGLRRLASQTSVELDRNLQPQGHRTWLVGASAVTTPWRKAIGLSFAAFVLVYGVASLWEAGRRRSRQLAQDQALARIDAAQPQRAAERKRRLEQLVQSGQRIAPKRRLPRFLSAALPPPRTAPIQEMIDQHPVSARAFVARVDQARAADHVAIDLCAWGFLQRHPEQRQVGFRGSLAVKLSVEGGRGRVVELLPVDGADDTFVSCSPGRRPGPQGRSKRPKPTSRASTTGLIASGRWLKADRAAGLPAVCGDHRILGRRAPLGSRRSVRRWPARGCC